MKKIQKSDANIWIISKDSISIPQVTYITEKDSFGKFLDDIQDFVKNKINPIIETATPINNFKGEYINNLKRELLKKLATFKSINNKVTSNFEEEIKINRNQIMGVIKETRYKRTIY